MENNSKPNILPVITLGAGALGLYLQTWLYATGVDKSGLLRNDHPANILLLILTAAVMAVMIFYLHGVRDIPAYRYLFPQSLPAAIGCMVAAAGVVVTVIMELVQSPDTISLISCVLGFLTAASLISTGICRQKRKRPNYYLHFAITAYLMIHVVSQYRTWSSEPQLQMYVFQLLASVFLMLCCYYRTLLDTGVNNRRRYVFFNYCALFFCCLSLVSRQWLFYASMAVWMASEQCSLAPRRRVVRMNLPENVLHCIELLENEGFNAYVVGGCVRDSLLGLTPQDYDLCTNATPDQIADTFSHHALVRSGEKHGTIGVILEGQVYEITTFRTEGGYSDSRHPDWVEFVPTVEEDLARRDFTVNAIAYSPTQGYLDPYGGQQDLTDNVLRAVGDPATRFEEDALRILRGVRFAIRYRLKLEEETEKAMIACVPLIDKIAVERVFSELCKLLPLADGEDMIRFAPIITHIIPELAPAVGFDQHNDHHDHDIFTHTAHVVGAAPQDLAVRLAALLHDVGKVSTFSLDENGIGHFYGHARAGADMANDILLRLKAPTALRERVVLLIAQHMTILEPDKRVLLRWLNRYDAETLRQLLALQRADFGNKHTEVSVETGEETAENPFDTIEQLLDQICEDTCLSIRDLAINGNDLLELGVQRGPHIGHCLNFLLELVQSELIANEKEELIKTAQEFFSKE